MGAMIASILGGITGFIAGGILLALWSMPQAMSGETPQQTLPQLMQVLLPYELGIVAINTLIIWILSKADIGRFFAVLSWFALSSTLIFMLLTNWVASIPPQQLYQMMKNSEAGMDTGSGAGTGTGTGNSAAPSTVRH